jgi:S-adenosylmethionine:tRNA ribosyltransferase-isomerase
MRTDDFDYLLPEELIAQFPLPEREASRMLCLSRQDGAVQDRMISDLPGCLRAGDLLIFNDTRVIKARLFAVKKGTGGRVEILVERVISPVSALAHLRASKAPRPGTILEVAPGVEVEVVGRQEDLFELALPQGGSFFDLLDQFGHVPLPPYIERADAKEDLERYQTVYARTPGAVAAPTAGLHFSPELMAVLETMGVEFGFVTLHVGAGTFKPVRVERVEEHVMHSEWISVSPALCRQIEAVTRRGGRVIAVGTTVVRALESAATAGSVRPYEGETAIFIYPGYEFKSGIEGLLTNFHLPCSTLLMLVSAFAGKSRVMAAYAHAVEQRYRFFSYGDAMLLF